MFVESFRVESPDVEYTRDFIHSSYHYSTTELDRERCADGMLAWIVKPTKVRYDFKTSVHVPKLG
jgi:myo-inositol-1-phosphate synthase